jgi:D-tyrosyl-tRNA(Tyr) deacylase
MLVFLGVADGDDETDVRYLAGKMAALRIFADSAGKMNLSLKDTGAQAMVVSQFTLVADTRKGNRPGFGNAAPPDLANRLYEGFVQELRDLGVEVKTGVFGADMAVTLLNDGPVTILLESK